MTNKARPYVICHMIPSVDGKIVMDGWKLPRATKGQYDAAASVFRADAWLVGRISMAPYAGGKRSGVSTRVPYADHVAPHAAKTFAIALDPSGRLAFKAGDIDGEHVISVLTRKAPRAHLAYLREKGVSYVIGGRREIALPQVMRKFRSLFGIKKILLEGGGKINGSLLKAGLIDELSILVAPVADGRTGAPTLFDSGANGGAVSGLKLLSLKTRPGGVVWLRYKVVHKGQEKL